MQKILNAISKWLSEQWHSLLQMKPAVLAVVVGLILLAVIILVSSRKKHNVRTIAVMAAMVGIGFVLSFIKLYTMPQGGSITLLSTLPILLCGYYFGVSAGILAGLSFGLLQAMQGAMAAPIMANALDYPIAFAMLGLSGLLRKAHPAFGFVLAGTARWICHVLSGVIFYSAYAGNANPWFYSMGYNVAVVLPELVLVVLISLSPKFKTITQKLYQH